MNPGADLRLHVDDAFQRACITRHIAFELLTTVVRFVGLGLGTAMVHESVAAGNPNITVRRIEDPGASYPTGLVNGRPSPSTPAVRAFLGMLG